MSDPVVLYILMRNDMASLNPGKAVAQGSHAANQMVYDLHNTENKEFLELLNEWQSSIGFGTCIVLGVTETQMRKVIGMAKAAELHAAITHDPTYPLIDGQTLHLIPVDTCAYIFCRKSQAVGILNGLELMP